MWLSWAAYSVEQSTQTCGPPPTITIASVCNKPVCVAKGQNIWHNDILHCGTLSLHVKQDSIKAHLSWGYSASEEKLGHLTATDHRNVVIKTETKRKKRAYSLENWEMKMILPLCGLIIVYTPGPFFFSLLTQINQQRSCSPAIFLFSSLLFHNVLYVQLLTAVWDPGFKRYLLFNTELQRENDTLESRGILFFSNTKAATLKDTEKKGLCREQSKTPKWGFIAYSE